MLMGPDSATCGHQTWTCQAELVCTTQPRGPRVWQQHRGSQCPLATPIRPKPRRLASARGRRRWVLSQVRRRRLSCVFAASWDCCRGGARATLLTSCECAPRLATGRNSSQAEACQEASSSSNCTPVNARNQLFPSAPSANATDSRAYDDASPTGFVSTTTYPLAGSRSASSRKPYGIVRGFLSTSADGGSAAYAASTSTPRT